MKGRKGCYSGGGQIRDLGGVKAPAYGSNPKLIKMAEGRSTGSDRMDGPDGGPSKARLDRPGRKAGGRTKAKG